MTILNAWCLDIDIEPWPYQHPPNAELTNGGLIEIAVFSCCAAVAVCQLFLQRRQARRQPARATGGGDT